MTHLLLEYRLAPDYLQRRGALRAEHLTLATAAHADGRLVLAGALGDPPQRALLVWRTADRGAVERFARADPYVVHGLVTDWQVLPWAVVVGEGAAPLPRAMT